MRYILLDANILISAFEPLPPFDQQTRYNQEQYDAMKAKRKTIRAEIRALLQDPEVALSISPLLRYEVLQGVEWLDTERHNTLASQLDGLESFNLTHEVATLAADLMRINLHEGKERNEQRKPHKLAFDALHFALAEHYRLEFRSDNQKDIDKLERFHGIKRNIAL